MPDQTDKFRFFPATFEGPATKAFAITSNESANLAFTTRAVYVGSAGNLVGEMADDASGTTTTFTAVPAGTTLPIRIRKVRTVGTANSVVGLY